MTAHAGHREGLGDAGQHIARTLSDQRHEVTIVDRGARRVEAMQGELDALVVAGKGVTPKFRREIGAGEADLRCTVNKTDEVNVIAALAGHPLRASRTVARVRESDYFGADESFSRDVLGIDFVIHPERATADDLAEAMSPQCIPAGALLMQDRASMKLPTVEQTDAMGLDPHRRDRARRARRDPRHR